MFAGDFISAPFLPFNDSGVSCGGFRHGRANETLEGPELKAAIINQ
jgi:hypothetical protein